VIANVQMVLVRRLISFLLASGSYRSLTYSRKKDVSP